MSDNKTIDQQFIEYVVKSLVSKPDAVIVDRVIDEKGVLLTLTVDPEDLGRVIGKRGATAQSLRTLLRALGTKQEARFNLKIFDNGTPKPERKQDEDRAEASDAQSSTESSDSGAEEAPAEETTPEEKPEESASVEDAWGSSDESSASEESADDDGDEMSAVERTRRELEDLDDLDV